MEINVYSTPPYALQCATHCSTMSLRSNPSCSAGDYLKRYFNLLMSRNDVEIVALICNRIAVCPHMTYAIDESIVKTNPSNKNISNSSNETGSFYF